MKRKHNHHGRAAGFTVVECLISLAICAMLMTAVTVAFNASLINFRENEDMFQSINNARQALSRMTSQLRSAGYHDPGLDEWLGVVHQASPTQQCEFYTPDAHHIIYQYRNASDPNNPNTLLLIQDGTAYKLCDNVTNASFTTTPSDGDPLDAKSVLISLSVRCGASERNLSAAAVVRRAL
jgi:type II secretory pathway pseudopilin PulG